MVAVDVGFDFGMRKARHFLDVLTKVVRIMGSELDRRQVALADFVHPAGGGAGGLGPVRPGGGVHRRGPPGGGGGLA